MKNLFEKARVLAKCHYQFFLILLLAIFLRTYRLNELTTFGGDQGMDFLRIREMVLYHNWTLLGLKTSIGPFFQGPLYLYVLYPFFVIFNLNPLAGAVTAIFMSTLAITLLYVTVKKYFSGEVALASTLLFAVSPEFIVYGNTPLYQNFLPFFIILSTFFFLAKKKNILVVFFLGLSVGLGMELHFMNVSLALALFVYLLFFNQGRFNTLLWYLVGVGAGLIPTFAFELRHNFLNTRLFLTYEGVAYNQSVLIGLFDQWTKGVARFLGGNSTFLGLLVLIFMGFDLLIKKPVSRLEADLSRLTLVVVAVIILLGLRFSAFGQEYILPAVILFIILLPISLKRIFPKKGWIFAMAVLILINLFSSTGRLSANHGYNMPEGLTMEKIVQAGRIVGRDSQTHANFNVASLLDGGTRAYPLRYAVHLAGSKPEAVESYPANNYVYVLSGPDERKLYESGTWEINSLSPFSIGATWDLKEGVFLYRLDRLGWKHE